jgi:signal transduction histidine kinase
VRPIADQAHVKIGFRSSAEVRAILGNEDAIRQIVLNLCRNAIRHTASGGSIEISIAVAGAGQDRRAQVEVHDTGCGIAAEHIQQLFEAGYSGGGQTTGLGLAVCRRLMAQHGGEISVASRVNEGSTFRLEFPIL